MNHSNGPKPTSKLPGVNCFRALLNLGLAVALALGALGPAATPAVHAANLQPVLAQMAAASPEQRVTVIVQKTTASDAAEKLAARLGGVITKDLSIINAFAAELTAGAARQLAASSHVRWVSLDAPMRDSSINSIDIRVAASSDDAEEEGSGGTHLGQGGMYLDSTDLELMRDNGDPSSGTQVIGLRFNGIGLPPGASITQATIRFRAIAADSGNSNSGPADFTIQAEAADNPGAFSTATNNLSNRPRTLASVQWTPSAWSAGTTYDTPSLTALVQEVVSRPGWAGGNSMVFILRCTDGVSAENCGSRSADSWNGSSATAPVLHIEWTDGAAPPPSGSSATLRENFDDDKSEGANWPGDPTWAGQAWTEIGESNGAEDGDVAVTDFLGGSRTGLRLQNGNKGLQSSVNLSNVNSATLSFGYRRKSLDDAADYVSVQVSANGGGAWTELAQIAGPGTDDELQIVSYDISAYANAATAIRFLNSASLGNKDKVYIDFVEIEYVQSGGAPTAPPAPTGNFTVRDEFNVTSYDNDDGTATWLGDWVEAGDDGSPDDGDITVEVDSCPNSGRCLEFDADGIYSISRAVDLSSADSATLSYVYTWDRDEDGVVVLEASADGSNWATLREYTSSASGGEQFDLTPYMSANTHLRFRVTNSGEDSELRVDDIEVAASSAGGGSGAVLSGIVRDEFGAASYSNNNGAQNWLAGWVETGDGSPSPSAGYVRVSSGALYLKYTNRALSRQANLVGATSATLSLKFKRSSLDGSSDYVALQVSANGGATWTEIDRFAGPSNDASYQSRSYDISAYAAANTAIRFITSSSLGSSDTVYFDDVQIEHACAECIDTSNLASTYLKAIGADQLWNGLGHFQGQGVGVAVVDSGIAGHSDLSNLGNDSGSRIKGRASFGGNQTVLDDANGHGTHVAGVIAGNGAQSNGANMGVAPEVELVDVQVANDQGMSSMSDIILGLQWILEHKAEYNIRVINLSLNSTVAESYHTSPLNAAVEILWFNGIVVVVSAGNNGTATLYPPANDPFVIVVGATDDLGTWSISDDVVAPFSAYGVTVDGFAKPDLVAPGRNIISLLASDDSNFALSHPANAVPGVGGVSYFRMSGTSAAAPMVSGAVALLLQAQPNLTPDQVKYRLMATANKNWPGYDAAKAGAGYLDILAAVFSNTTESANTGLQASQLLTTGSDPINSSVNWNSVNWNSVNWNSVNWNSVNWNSVNWNSVNWNSDYWEP